MDTKPRNQDAVAQRGRTATLLAMLVAVFYSAPGVCDGFTISVSNSVDLGTITPGTSNTTFTISSTGAVTQSPASSAGGATRTNTLVSPVVVSINCDLAGTNGPGDGCVKKKTNTLQVSFGNLWTSSMLNITGIRNVSSPSGWGCTWPTGATNSITGTCTGLDNTTWPVTFTFEVDFLVAANAYSSYQGNQSCSFDATFRLSW